MGHDRRSPHPQPRPRLRACGPLRVSRGPAVTPRDVARTSSLDRRAVPDRPARREETHRGLRHQGAIAPDPARVTVWLTGLPSAGKTTIANLVGEQLAERGRAVEVLDGDVVRAHLSKGLGFSKADRDENIRRIGFVAGLPTGHGVTVLVSAISPYRAVRDEVRAAVERVGASSRSTATDLATCQGRDVKGLYARTPGRAARPHRGRRPL